MSRIMPLSQSIARPDSSLIDHLIGVRKSMESFFHDEDSTRLKLIGLAGLCHDIAKNHVDWQRYIRDEKISKGPNHSDCGAFFFSYIGYHLLTNSHAWDHYKVEWLWLTRDIADHHSRLKDVDNTAWLKRYDWKSLDITGIESFFREQYSELSDLSLEVERLEDWIVDGFEVIDDVEDELDLGYGNYPSYDLMVKIQKWRMLTTCLIAGDRFDVKDVSDHSLREKNVFQYIDEYCSQVPQDHPLSKVRKESQEKIMEDVKQHPNDTFYMIDMPTGYGKTLTSLKIAGWFVEKQDYQKIIYVAPYLSILEQNSQEIKKATGIIPLEHHSLAIIDEDTNQRTEGSQLAMESWAHAIVCTSFQQLWKAIFPGRSQDALRRTFLQKSIVIIDEPQIFQAEVWNLFLVGLDALSDLFDLKIIFLSATMPPFDYGLREQPTKLQIKAEAKNDRYQLFVETGRQDESSVIKLLEQNERETQAIILNTIEDSIRVFKKLEDKRSFLIHGMMLPIHKKIMIEKIKHMLDDSHDDPLYVVSTQILEAGVNMSFQHVARALPILPSIVQAAGRVNRHLEGSEKGRMTVFPFYRNSEKDTRSCIYSKGLQKITDALLFRKTSWSETELTALVQEYYQQMFKENTYETALNAIRDAAEGRWESIYGYQPFQTDYIRLPLFIPWNPVEFGQIPDDISYLQNKFDVYDPNDIYERYCNKSFVSSMDFADRKSFMILFHYFVLNVPVKKALRVVSKDDYLNKCVPMLSDSDAYDDRLGFKIGFEDSDNII